MCSNCVWSVCSKLPGVESCNGLDDDCDGYTDEVCNCTDGATRSCGSDVGECVSGVQTCVNGNWGSCTGSVGPVSEVCNNKDDDCDGTVDGMTNSSGCVQLGVCSKLPGVESCNGLDDDCDGSVDEVCNCTNGATKSCGSDVGECVSGVQTCVNGNWGSCIGSVGPVSEVCNNKDDNCDGTGDGLTSSSSCLQAGICQGSFQTCSGGVWSSCSKLPTTASCNGLDDDCDGSIGELFDNKGLACDSGVGECKRRGVYVCSGDG